MAVRRSGDWEGWLKFFLRGIERTATEATATGLAIVELREHYREIIATNGVGLNGQILLDRLFRLPIITVNRVRDELGVSYPTANNLVQQLESLEMLEEISGRERNRLYRFTPFVLLFRDPEPFTIEENLQVTEVSRPDGPV